MSIEEDSSGFVSQLRHAASAQRTYWRKVRPEDVELLQLDELVASAEAVASELEKRYKGTQSVSWTKWCQSSLAHWGSQGDLVALTTRAQSPICTTGGACHEDPAHYV